MAPVLWSKIHLRTENKVQSSVTIQAPQTTSSSVSPTPKSTTQVSQDTSPVVPPKSVNSWFPTPHIHVSSPVNHNTSPPRALLAQELCDHHHPLPERPEVLHLAYQPCALGLSSYGADEPQISCNKKWHKLLLQCLYCDAKMCRKCWHAIFPRHRARNGEGPEDRDRRWGKDGSKQRENKLFMEELRKERERSKFY
nr:hypothetical protein B0A51_00940 [Rachicladosporium sp. CCFEE 5018]